VRARVRGRVRFRVRVRVRVRVRARVLNANWVFIGLVCQRFLSQNCDRVGVGCELVFQMLQTNKK
jgi:hypothetical protein